MILNKQEIENKLESNIPRNEISIRDGGFGGKLSYFETWKAINLANSIFGNLSWSSETTRLELMDKAEKPTFIATVRVTVNLGNGEKSVREGTGYGSDKSKNNPYELAAKEAESDALKRALSKFGNRLGNALYDKSQEYVTDESNETNESTARKESKENTKSTSSNPPSKETGNLGTGDRTVSKPTPTKMLKEQIKNSFAVLQAKKAITKEDFVKNYLNGGKTDELTEEATEAVLQKIKTNFAKELGL